MNNILGFTSVYNYIWMIPVLFSIHEVEEWNILRWYKKYYRNLPESTNTSIRIHIIIFSIASFLLTFLAYAARETFLFSLIIVFLSCFILQNFIQHVIWTLQLKTYSPGLATVVPCVLYVLFVNVLFIQNGLIILPFYLMVLLVVPPVIRTMNVKGEMTKDIVHVHHFFIRMEKAFNRIVKKESN